MAFLCPGLPTLTLPPSVSRCGSVRWGREDPFPGSRSLKPRLSRTHAPGPVPEMVVSGRGDGRGTPVPLSVPTPIPVGRVPGPQSRRMVRWHTGYCKTSGGPGYLQCRWQEGRDRTGDPPTGEGWEVITDATHPTPSGGQGRWFVSCSVSRVVALTALVALGRDTAPRVSELAGAPYPDTHERETGSLRHH